MNYRKIYADYLSSFLDIKAPVKMVCDASNGTAGSVLEQLKVRGVELILINGRPDGRFPAHGPDPWKPGAMDGLGKKVVASRADFGAIFDADGDRAFFVDDKGRYIYGDTAISLISHRFAAPWVIDVRVGWLLKKLPKRKWVESRVGHFFIKKLMKKRNLEFGAEISGHYYFKNRIGKSLAYFDSGLRAAIEMANCVAEMKSKGEKLSQYIDALPQYPHSGEVNYTVSDKDAAVNRIFSAYRSRAKKISRLDGLTIEAKSYWFNVRQSNTEPLLRLNLEALDGKTLEKELEKLERLIRG